MMRMFLGTASSLVRAPTVEMMSALPTKAARITTAYRVTKRA